MLRPRAGFTLVELVVALTVGTLALLAARGALVQLAAAADATTVAARRADREANAERLLRAVVGQLEVGTAPGRHFSGDAAAATFTSWCDTPGGWEERCDARLAIDVVPGGRGTTGAGRRALTLTLGRATGRDTLVIRDDVGASSLRYLTDPAAGGRWIAAWPPAVTAPLALGIVLDADTLILRIGPRG